MATLTVPVIGSIDYYERPGSPEESYGQGNTRVRRVFDVAWADRWYFCQAMLGWSTLGGKTPDQFHWITRQPPQPYPVDILKIGSKTAYKPWLYATTIDRMEGVGISRDANMGAVAPGTARMATTKDDNDVFYYDTARITVGYETVPYGVLSDQEMREKKYTDDGTTGGNPSEATLKRYVSRHIQPTVEAIKLPFGQYKFTSTPSIPAATGLHRLLVGHELQFTWHNVPALPDGAFQLIGKVNDDVFLDAAPGFNVEELGISGYSYPKWTLLVLAVEAKSYRVIGGMFNTDVLIRMKYLPNVVKWGSPNNAAGTSTGHRGILRYYSDSKSIPSPAPVGAPSQYYDYETVTSDGTTSGTYLYDTADFDNLFLV